MARPKVTIDLETVAKAEEELAEMPMHFSPNFNCPTN